MGMVELKERPAAVGVAESRDEAIRETAVQQLKKKRDFKGHLFTYVVINAALWTIWAVDGAVNDFGWPWPAVVTFFWGLFVLGNARDTYWKKPLTEEEIQREIRRLNGFG